MLNEAAVHAALLCHKDGLDWPPWRGRADLSQGLGQCWPPGQPVSVPYPNPRHRSGMQKEQRGPGIWSSVELGSKPSSSAGALAREHQPPFNYWSQSECFPFMLLPLMCFCPNHSQRASDRALVRQAPRPPAPQEPGPRRYPPPAGRCHICTQSSSSAPVWTPSSGWLPSQKLKS